MIRVNLLRNLGMAAGSPAAGLSQGPVFSQDLQKQAMYRLAFIFVCLGLLIFYEKVQLSAKRRALDEANVEVGKIRAEKEKFGDAAPIVQKYNEQKTKLDAQVKVLESLTANRLREVKLLDVIQSKMPAKAWLQEMKMDQGRVTMVGYAPNEQDVSELYRALESNALFSSVRVKSEAVESPSVGLVQQFEFNFLAGKVK